MGGRVQYPAQDVERLAGELPADERQKVEIVEILPPSVLLDHIRQLEGAIISTTQREGQLQAELARRPSVEELATIRDALAEERADRRGLEAELTAARAQLGQAGQVRRWLIGLVLVLLVLALLLALALTLRLALTFR